ncbi:MAG: hypothetical protein U1E65_35490 [Myxococcota bacterium]
MLLLRHQFKLPEIGAAFAQDELRSEELVVCNTVFEGGKFDQVRGLPAGQRHRWSKAVIVLEGHLLARGALLRPGDLIISRDWDDYPMRALEERTHYLLLSWRHGMAGDRPSSSGVIRDARTLAGARSLAQRLRDRQGTLWLQHALGALTRSLAWLGAGINEEAAREGPSDDPRHLAVAQALEASLFPLKGQPMVVDFSAALGTGERQTQRLLADYFRRFYVTAPGWRQFVYGMRLEVGVFLASNRRATTEILARALGFASSGALCHAFHRAGLPSPQGVRSALSMGK